MEGGDNVGTQRKADPGSGKAEKPAIQAGFKAYTSLLCFFLGDPKVLPGYRATESHLPCFRFY